MSPPFLWKPSI